MKKEGVHFETANLSAHLWASPPPKLQKATEAFLTLATIILHVLALQSAFYLLIATHYRKWLESATAALPSLVSELLDKNWKLNLAISFLAPPRRPHTLFFFFFLFLLQPDDTIFLEKSTPLKTGAGGEWNPNILP